MNYYENLETGDNKENIAPLFAGME